MRILAAVILVGVIGYWLFVATPGPRSLRAFDPDRAASLETEMWQAYYQQRTARLAFDLLLFTHDQFHYPWAKAAVASYHLARAASTFAKIRSNYGQVLPDLERAYTIAREWTGEPFDPAAVARAELAWWVARRQPGQDSPANVGRLIAEENAMLFQTPVERVLAASTLRATAGKLRDDAGADADWTEVRRLLTGSYRGLHAAVQR